MYGARAAEAAGVSPEVMRLETERAFKRRVRRDAKRQEKIDLAPAAKLQPRSKTIRYDNLKSAMAEEGLLGQILREPALLDRVELEPEEFSCELLGRVYGLLRGPAPGGASGEPQLPGGSHAGGIGPFGLGGSAPGGTGE